MVHCGKRTLLQGESTGAPVALLPACGFTGVPIAGVDGEKALERLGRVRKGTGAEDEEVAVKEAVGLSLGLH